MDAQAVFSVIEFPTPVVLLQDRCQPAWPEYVEWFPGVEGSIADPRIGVAYPLNDGKQVIFDSAETARLIDADQRESVFVNVEVVADPNILTIYPNGIVGSTLVAPYTPPGKVLLGARLETLDGEFVPDNPADPVDTDPLEPPSPGGAGTRACLYRIWGVAPEWDVDGSQTVDVADLLAVVNRLREYRDQQRSPTDPRALAMDLNIDGILSEADLLAISRQLRTLSSSRPIAVDHLAAGDGA